MRLVALAAWLAVVILLLGWAANMIVGPVVPG